jgi:hypothetical protein
MADANDLVRVKYSGRDFWTFFDDLKTRVRAKYADDYNDFVESSLGVMLIDLVSFAAETLSFYLDRQATDCYLDTVQTRTLAERLVRQLGYKMHGATSHSVDLSVTLKKAWSFEVIVPAGFRFVGPNNLIYESTQDVSYPASDVGPKTISVREGEIKTETFVSDGTKNQVFELSGVAEGLFLLSSSVKVTVGGSVWTENDFLEFLQTDHYEVAYGSSPPLIRFGNGVAGNIPEVGSTIIVEYVVSHGKSGFAASGAIDSELTKLRVGGNDIDMTVTNPLASGGGSDSESIAHAKSYAPSYHRTRQVAVTKPDYETLASVFSDSQFGSVAKAKAVSSRSADEDLYLADQLSDIRNAADNPYPVVQAEVDAIRSTDLPAIHDEVVDTQDKIDEMQVLVGTPEVVSPPAAATGLYLDVDGSIDDLRDIKNKQDEMNADANDIGDKSSDIDTNATNAYNKINGMTTAGSSQLTSADKSSLISWISAIQTDNGVISSEKNNIVTASASSKNLADGVISALSGMKIDFDSLRTDLAAADVNMVDIDGHRSDVDAHAVTIENVVVDTSNIVNQACDNIYSHVDAFLSKNCKANLVEVPILVKDVDGFYQEPSLALQKALQTYLDARKEPTVTVKVLSGGESLVAVDATVVLGTLSSAVKPVVVATAKAIVDNLLKERDFGVSLYRSQVVDALAGISGVKYVNFSITSPSTKLDSSGNLIIEKNEIITKGTIDVSAVEAE